MAIYLRDVIGKSLPSFNFNFLIATTISSWYLKLDKLLHILLHEFYLAFENCWCLHSLIWFHTWFIFFCEIWLLSDRFIAIAIRLAKLSLSLANSNHEFSCYRFIFCFHFNFAFIFSAAIVLNYKFILLYPNDNYYQLCM